MTNVTESLLVSDPEVTPVTESHLVFDSEVTPAIVETYKVQNY